MIGIGLEMEQFRGIGECAAIDRRDLKLLVFA